MNDEKKYTVVGTDVEEVKRLNKNSGLTYNQVKELLAKQMQKEVMKLKFFIFHLAFLLKRVIKITLFFNTIEQLLEWRKQHEEVGKDNVIDRWRYCPIGMCRRVLRV